MKKVRIIIEFLGLHLPPQGWGGSGEGRYRLRNIIITMEQRTDPTLFETHLEWGIFGNLVFPLKLPIIRKTSGLKKNCLKEMKF